MTKRRHSAWCGHVSQLIIQDIIISSTHVILLLTQAGSGEVERCRDDAMPYGTLCMGNIYQSDITEIYAALLYPL